MDEVREELLRGEDKLLKRILETWERRYSSHLKDLTEKYGEVAVEEDVMNNCNETEARDVLRDAVDLKARVKAEFELLQQLRSEIEDSESAFDWKVRFERLEKENLHLREKVEDLKDQVSELERARQSKEFEIKNQRRYYDNKIEDLERQLRRAPNTPGTPAGGGLTSSFSTPTMQKVHQYTALTVISDDEDDFTVPAPTPTPPPPPVSSGGRALPAIPLSASSPKPPPRRESGGGVTREEHERVLGDLAKAQGELARLREQLETSRAPPELTASLERLREELCLDSKEETPSDGHFDELSYSGLRAPLESFNGNSTAAEANAIASFTAGTNNSNAAEDSQQPMFDLETLAGVIVEASLHNAVSTMRHVELALTKERAKAAAVAVAAAAGLDSNRLAEAQEALERRHQLRAKFVTCRQRLWQKVKKDVTLRKDIEELETLIGAASPDYSEPPNDDSSDEGEAPTTSGTCAECERLRNEVTESAMQRVQHLARVSELEEELVAVRGEAGELQKTHSLREAELESHIAKLRQLSVKDNEEIDSLIGELDSLRQLLASKQSDFQAQLDAAARASDERAEAVRQESRKEVEAARRDKEVVLDAAAKETSSVQDRISDQLEEEARRMRLEHEQALDMLDQKYQDEFVDLERHHTEEILALRKDLEERFARERARLASEAEREVAALCEKLQEARAAAESLRQRVRQQESVAVNAQAESELFASQLLEQLIQYFSALEVKLTAVCTDQNAPETAPKTSHWKFLLRVTRIHATDEGVTSSFPLNCATQLQPALCESLEVLSGLVSRVLTALEAAQMTGETAAKRVKMLEANLENTQREAETEHAGAEELREGLREQTQELHRAEALIRTYAEKESELTERLAELDEERTRIGLELDASKARVAEYLRKEEAMDEERVQLDSVRDILNNSMTDSSRALFEANQSLQDEKSHLESEFGRRFEALQAHRVDLEAQVEALEAELERREETHRVKEEDQRAQLESVRKQVRADARFLEEQTREREAERDHFQAELDLTNSRLRDLAKENAQLRDQVALMASSGSPASSPGAPPPPPPPPSLPDTRQETAELRQRLTALEAELEEAQGSSEQFQEQIEELMAENARLTIEMAQQRGSSSGEEEEDEGRASADSLEVEVTPKRVRSQAMAPEQSRAAQELETEAALRKSQEAEAKLEEAEAELSRMRHVHEELQNDKEELQRQVCHQLSLLSALRQEVDAKRHLKASTTASLSSSSVAQEMEERVEELDAELSRVHDRLSASVHEVTSLRSEISRVAEEKARLEANSGEVDATAISALTNTLLAEKNEEIDSLQALLAAAETRERNLAGQLEEREEDAARIAAEITRLREKLLEVARTAPEEALRSLGPAADGPSEEEVEEEVVVMEEETREVRELNIPASDEEGEATEVVLEVVKAQKPRSIRRSVRRRKRSGAELQTRLGEVDGLVELLRLELVRRQEEVAAIRVREETLDKEVRSLLAYQSQLQEDYDVVQSMLEETQQLPKELEDFDPQVFKERFEEREAALLKELKEVKCLADEREEDLYVVREEKEQLEANLAELLAENSNQRDELAAKTSELSEMSAQLETQGRELAASLARCEALHRQLLPPQDVADASAASEGPAHDVCDGATVTERDSGLSASLFLPATPLLPEREVMAAEAEAARWRTEAARWRETAEDGQQREAEALRRLEARAERAERETVVERSERQRLLGEKERLKRDLDTAQRELDCQRSRLHLLLHGAEDELEEALSSLSPRSHDEDFDGDVEEEELMALHRGEVASPVLLPSPLPQRVQSLLDRIHKEGVQLLSLSELQYLQTHAAVIRHKLEAVRRQSGLKQRSPEPGVNSDGVLEDLQSAWRHEKEALQAANESLKDLLTQLSQSNGLVGPAGDVPVLNRNNNSLGHAPPAPPPPPCGPDWRQQMISSVERAYREERQALLAQMRSEVAAASAITNANQPQVSAQMSPERRLRQLESRYHQSETQQRASLERLYQADRQSLLEETRSLRRRLHTAEQELREMQGKQAALTASDLNNRHANTLRESEMAGQLERLQLAFGSLHVDLEAANKRLGESEERAMALSCECQNAVKRASELEAELTERETKMGTLSEQLDRESRRRQECMNLADDEKRMLDHLRSQLDSEKARASRLETELKEERTRGIERARDAAAVEQELRCQLDIGHRRIGELEAALETERLRLASGQRELESERSLRRAREDEAESRIAELSTNLELERARIEELRSQLDRERRQLRQARDNAEEERAGRRQAAQVEAEAQALLTAQLEQSRARAAQLEAGLEAERARLRKLAPRAEEVASALERERAAGTRLQAELGAARSAQMEAETRAERLQDCLRNLSEEHETERRRWREQERRLSSELSELSARLSCSAELASSTSSRLTTALRASNGTSTALGLPSPEGDGDGTAVTVGAVLAALLAAENQLDVMRSLDPEPTEDLASLGRQVRFVRQRLEVANGGRTAANGGGASAALVRQNCEMSRMVVRLARDKEELRSTLCRLEEEVSHFRSAPPELSNGHASSGRVTPCASDDSVLTNRLYAKYLRSESKRRALVYQKRYLLLLLGGFRECEEAVLVAVASMSVRSVNGGSSSSSAVAVPPQRFRLSRALMRFRAGVRVAVAVHRMRAMVQRWAALTGAEQPSRPPSSSSTPGRRVQNGQHTFLTPPTREAASLSPIPSSPVSQWSSPGPRSSSLTVSPYALGVRPLRSPALANNGARSSPNEEFLHRLERLQRRMENYVAPAPNARRHREPALSKLATSVHNCSYSSVR